MKQLTAIALTLLFCILVSLTSLAAAPTFADDFSDHNKSEAKSDNIIYEIDSSQDNNTVITLNKPGEGYIIWKLEDLAFINLKVLIFDGYKDKVDDCIKLSSSDDGISWQSLEYKSSLTEASGWDNYLLSAKTIAGQKFIKVTIINNSDIAWSVKLDRLELYNEADKPTSTPPTGDGAVLYYILIIGSIFHLTKIKSYRSIKK